MLLFSVQKQSPTENKPPVRWWSSPVVSGWHDEAVWVSQSQCDGGKMFILQSLNKHPPVKSEEDQTTNPGTLLGPTCFCNNMQLMQKHNVITKNSKVLYSISLWSTGHHGFYRAGGCKANVFGGEKGLHIIPIQTRTYQASSPYVRLCSCSVTRTSALLPLQTGPCSLVWGSDRWWGTPGRPERKHGNILVVT